MVARECEPELPVQVLGPSVDGTATDHYVPDITRARAELALEVWIPLGEAIRRTLSWQRENL